MKQVINRVHSFAEEMQLHYASPNKDLVTEILQLDASELSSLPAETISKYIFVLGQYLVMLQYNENLKNIEYRLAQKTFEYNLNKEKLERDGIVGKTAKERDAWVLINVPEIRAMSDELVVLEAERTIIDGMVRAVEGLLNALKKEISGRYTD